MDSAKRVSVGIDFGTTFSGYALSFQPDNTNILTSKWTDNGITTVKTPTCILFDQSGRFRYFGYEAENRYSELARNEEHHPWFFFRHFKLLLHKEQEISKETMISSLDGKQMKAMDVFSAAILFLKDHVIRRYQGMITQSNTGWVLTVPAIWGDKARQFMRLAAEKAGLRRDSLTLALEPETASVYCKEFVGDMSRGHKYVILDCGGGTVDVAVHKIGMDSRLSAEYRPTGGVWGGINVDDALISFLIKTCGADTVSKLTQFQHMELMRAFESAKVAFASSSSVISLPLPFQLRNTFDSKEFRGKADVEFDRLRLSNAMMRSFFEKPVQKIVTHLQVLFTDTHVKNLDTIYMVGGFSLSPVLQDAVRKAFPNISVVVPEDPSSAVVIGAVLYGREPRVICKRKSAFTYGFKSCADFQHGIHLICKKFNYGNDIFCIDIFDKLVTINDTLEVGVTQAKKNYSPAYASQDRLNIELYRSTEVNPFYVTDPGCELVGKIRVYMPDISRGLDRSLDVTVMFEDSELNVEAIDKSTMQKYTAEFDFIASR